MIDNSKTKAVPARPQSQVQLSCADGLAERPARKGSCCASIDVDAKRLTFNAAGSFLGSTSGDGARGSDATGSVSSVGALSTLLKTVTRPSVRAWVRC